MENIQFGLKLWSTNSDLLNLANDLIENDTFQYIELTPIPDTRIAPFLDYDIPYIIHITTERHGINIADKEKRELNIKTIDHCIEWGDKLNAKYLILHPGFGDINNTIEFLQEINDKRILIENMPKVGLENESMIGYNPEQIEKLTEGKFGFCMDLNHAMKAAISLNTSYHKFINEFMKLNPALFHISDGRLDYEKDEHLNIGEGDYDFKFLMDKVMDNESQYLTLETPRTSFEDDLKNLKSLQKIIHRVSI
ncbi:MAG: TIM barrel protein [Candidatus Peribacteraceae bacterium]|nr:TIM barrel protein [Candidatus Peribacteraceae bacterium]